MWPKRFEEACIQSGLGVYIPPDSRGGGDVPEGGGPSSMELQGTPPKFLDLPAASDSTPGKLVA